MKRKLGKKLEDKLGNRKDNGFTLVEILIAIVILTLAVFPFLQVIANNTNVTIEGKRKFVASHYAKELLEEIKLKRFDEKKKKRDTPNAGQWSRVETGTAIIVREDDEDKSSINRAENDWDDIDDYNGYNESGIGILDFNGLDSNKEPEDKNYYRKVSVIYVNDSDLTPAPIDTTTDTKKVKVECYYKDSYNINNNYNTKNRVVLIWYLKKK
ncbi:prepilin-type N-terminal cleavage/methylation domain-containing protein [Haliovirga abyssi]|uniref:Prepilin-type N-terminal cleavage/methylation domain-containing protein n=1 Tax=Haliovirga abyssi TaxID=2996794 RepID=A0AAU9E0K8_9FUSO|nr:prepilin-type N-terminal cleavage/methylation domain-containing protein [Haliovirga abyssi]BDU51440.1 hypothetical protein HLVA_20090 [Haliovirga abyssi]